MRSFRAVWLATNGGMIDFIAGMEAPSADLPEADDLPVLLTKYAE